MTDAELLHTAQKTLDDPTAIPRDKRLATGTIRTLTELVETRKERAIWENLPYPANRAVAMTKEIEELTAERDALLERVERLERALRGIAEASCICSAWAEVVPDPLCPRHSQQNIARAALTPEPGEKQ